MKSIVMNTTAQWGNNATGITAGNSQTFYVLLKDTAISQLGLILNQINLDSSDQAKKMEV
jgi:hypothetical protein